MIGRTYAARSQRPAASAAPVKVYLSANYLETEARYSPSKSHVGKLRFVDAGLSGLSFGATVARVGKLTREAVGSGLPYGKNANGVGVGSLRDGSSFRLK